MFGKLAIDLTDMMLLNNGSFMPTCMHYKLADVYA